MKSRSHRLPAAAAATAADPDDWGDGSWTVDCACGVNFDDGEEMVSCDECGVWVHTRCARFVRGEASFACHKCKAASSAAANANDDTVEETEVAQLLAELPTKATATATATPSPHLAPYRRPHVPLEERVHVHGVPGGDPSLFDGVTPVFGRQLWKTTRCVPKKFESRCRDFPCWYYEDEETNGADTPASKGADVLFSLSKESAPAPAPVPRFPLPPEGVQNLDGEKAPWAVRSKSVRKKERSRNRTPGPHSSKKRARGESKDFNPVPNKRKHGFGEDGGVQAVGSGTPELKRECRKEERGNKGSSGPRGVETGSKMKLVIKASRGGLSDEDPKQKSSSSRTAKAEKFDPPERVVPQVEKIDPQVEANCPTKGDATEELGCKSIQSLKHWKDENYFEVTVNGSSGGVITNPGNSKHTDALKVSCSDKEGNPVITSAHDVTMQGSKLDNYEVKLEESDDSKLCSIDHMPHQRLQKSIAHLSVNLQKNESKVTLPSSYAHKFQTVGRDSETSFPTHDTFAESNISRFGELKLHDQAVETIEISGIQGDTLELMHGSKPANGCKEVGDVDSSLEKGNKCKPTVVYGKISSRSVPLSESSVSDSCKLVGTLTSLTPGMDSDLIKQHVKLTACTAGQPDDPPFTEGAQGSMQEIPSKVKGQPKSSCSSGSKSLHANRVYVSGSKPLLSDSKEPLLSPSSETPITENTTMANSAEAAGSSQTQKYSLQIKLAPSGTCQKSDKTNQHEPTLEVFNHSVTIHPLPSVNATATLSDEELALLLHQELNSSPRVPRVPRVRQSVGMQSGTPSASSILKRSSSSGGRDQVSVFRRKGKEDATRDGCRSSRVFHDETKRAGRATAVLDQKHHELASMSDFSAKKDLLNKSPDIMVSLKKNNPVESIEDAHASPGPLDSSGEKKSSERSGSKNFLDEVGSSMRRTLPGLIDEILNIGKHMTYDELCEAVRPHWHNMRKPNGERYAYPSHSHAVLDCLRNRSEWAHLIDRGPKTNSSKRRRKTDADMANFDLENEEARNKSGMDIEDKSVDSHREDFPKGKRKARKRRRLELGGKGAVKRLNQDNLDHDPATASHSSNDGTEGNFTEDDIQGAGQHAMEDEVSSPDSDDVD